MDKEIRKYVRACEVCQKVKITAPKKYGKIPLNNFNHVTPFEHIQMDLAGPWKICLQHEDSKQTMNQIWILTIIDVGSNWIEIYPITNIRSVNIAQIFDNKWLCHYLRPLAVTCDTVGEFSGFEFQELLQIYGIAQKLTTVQNPQANSFVERIYLTIRDHL